MFALWLVLGCAPLDIQATVDACGPEGLIPEGGEYIEQTAALEQRCVEQLAGDLGIDWESFGADGPEAFEGEDTNLKRLLVAAEHLLRLEAGSVAETLETRGLPRAMHRRLSRIADAQGLTEDDPAGRLFYALLAHNTRVTRSGVLSETALMSFTRRRRLLRVGELGKLTQLERVGLLVHEPYHRWSRHDRRCTINGVEHEYDSTPDSAHGAASLYYYRLLRGAWLTVLTPEDSAAGLHRILSAPLQESCSQISDIEGFEPCEY